MKILFVYSALVIDDVSGTYYHNFLDAIIERYSVWGELTVCVSCKKSKKSFQTLLNTENVKFLFVCKENTIKKRFFNRKGNKRTLRNAVEENNLLIAHVPDSVAVLATTYAQKLSKPYIAVAVGCPWDALWNHSFKGKLMAPLAFIEMRRTLKHAPYAIYVTSFFLQDRYPCTGETLACSDVDLQANCDEIFDKRLQKIANFSNDNVFTVVTSAAIDVRFKGQADVIKAISLLKKRGIEVHYYLIGGGDNSFLKEKAKESGVVEQIYFLGLQSHQKVLEILDNIDLYIQPSRQEGLPRAVVEAMSRALPCLGTKTGGIPELLSADCLYCAGDVIALAQLIEGMMKSKERLRCQAKCNFERAKEYDGKLLDKKRSMFLKNIIQNIENNC